jgi:hypothetical protein
MMINYYSVKLVKKGKSLIKKDVMPILVSAPHMQSIHHASEHASCTPSKPLVLLVPETNSG